MNTEISFYYLDCCPFIWKPAHLLDDFSDMKRMGGDSVCISILEEDHSGNYKGKVALAHEAGLKVYAVPSRVGGLFAGSPKVPSMFCARNMDTLMMTRNGTPQDATAGLTCCANNPKFQGWFLQWIERLVSESGVEGVVFDEPKEAHKPCYCDICVGLCEARSDEALTRLREEAVAALIGQACAAIKQTGESHKTILFVMPDATENFINRLLAERDVDYFGNDGPMCHQGPRAQKHQKTRLTQSVPAIFEKAGKAGKKTFTLIETFHVLEVALPELRAELKKTKAWRADMYAFYYYGPSNENAAEVMRITEGAIRELRNE